MERKNETKKTVSSNRPEARRTPPSAIAWPYRWLFALTECGEQRSPAACLCARVRTNDVQECAWLYGYRHTEDRLCASLACAGAFRNRSLFYLCEGVVSPRIAGTLGARNLEAGVVSLIVMKLISVLKFRNRYFEIAPLFCQRVFDIFCNLLYRLYKLETI